MFVVVVAVGVMLFGVYCCLWLLPLLLLLLWLMLFAVVCLFSCCLLL